MTHTHTFVWAICPKCGHQMKLVGDYLENEQLCGGCNTQWQLYSDRPGLEIRWEDQDSVTTGYIAPDDKTLIPPHEGPFKP